MLGERFCGGVPRPEPVGALGWRRCESSGVRHPRDFNFTVTSGFPRVGLLLGGFACIPIDVQSFVLLPS